LNAAPAALVKVVSKMALEWPGGGERIVPSVPVFVTPALPVKAPPCHVLRPPRSVTAPSASITPVARSRLVIEPPPVMLRVLLTAREPVAVRVARETSPALRVTLKPLMVAVSPGTTPGIRSGFQLVLGPFWPECHPPSPRPLSNTKLSARADEANSSGSGSASASNGTTRRR
jgi:hypothetical protein